MNKTELIQQIRSKSSYLCIGLDTDIDRIPEHLLKFDDPVFEFNRQIIDATHHLCISYKLNIAFYEALGTSGWKSLEKTIAYIPENIFTIADAKRGDIGNTADQYAKTFFETLNFDAVTLSPYMGKDSISPFLAYKDKWAIVLGLTSNKGAEDIQLLEHKDGHLYEYVIKKVSEWGNENNLMFVAGATQDKYLSRIREIIPSHFLLIPGVGSQGGDLETVSNLTMNKDTGILINVSRAIIYAAKDKTFAERAALVAAEYQSRMKKMLLECEV